MRVVSVCGVVCVKFKFSIFFINFLKFSLD